MLDFKIAPKITKDLLLSKFSEETIFCYYLGINSISKKLIRNTTRDDKNPTCGFYRNSSGTLILHDFATGEYFNCFSYVMKVYHCDYHKALDIIASDFGLINYDNKPVPTIRHVPTFKAEEITKKKRLFPTDRKRLAHILYATINKKPQHITKR